jgi:ABC-2 type transport system permease protein
MQKIWLIIKREYLTRVRKKLFIVTTLVFPILFFGVMILLGVMGAKSKESQNILVLDNSNYFEGKLTAKKEKNFSFEKDKTWEEVMATYEQDGYSGALLIPENIFETGNKPEFRSPKKVGFDTEEFLRDEINDLVEAKRMSDKGITKTQLDSLKSNIKIIFSDNEGKRSSTIGSFGIGYMAGIIMYITLLIYGTMVMRGVMEEKTNRIAEIIISSVKPFQLMMGKIIGIAGVGLTQFLIWILFIILLSTAGASFFPELFSQAQEARQMGMAAGSNDTQMIQNIMAELNQLPWLLIIGTFIFYFIGGYLFYASLFAAVGSAINEDPSEAQSMSLPITLPIIIGFFIMINSFNNPNGTLAVVGSMVPFTSPIVMMGRIGFGVPWWQLALSMSFLVIGFVFTTWLSAKIYRTGILLYGKKVNWNEMIKWLRR